MHHPRLAPARRVALLLAISISIAACQHVDQGSSRMAKTYNADGIDIERGTVEGVQISALVDEDVRLRGFVKSSAKGNTVMFLSSDEDKIDPDSHRHCINLIIDRAVGFDSPDVSRHVFTGRFVLVERFDASVVYLEHEGIRFNTDCQALKQPNRYPYFLVKAFER